ncbi:MAG: hypothetical protein IKU45_04110 [Clostridia bacterium]|nr:hypothetical protein [Clostridia bacterium]
MVEMNYKKNCKVAIFKAPESTNYRQVVKDHMLEMSNITWTPKETFPIKWKGEPRFKIELVYEKGKTYHGMTYTDTKGCLDLFKQLLKDGVFTPNSEYYEECFGNHCSASMDMAYQQIIDFPYAGGVKPNPQRGTMLKLVGDLQIPKQYGVRYDSADVWRTNSKQKVMEAFAAVDTGDIMYYCDKNRSGHARMVSRPSEVVRFESGEIDPENSYVICIEQTNCFDKPENVGEKNTTWYIDHKYSFAKLYEKRFMPVTLTIYTSGEKSKDAFIIYEGDNNAETIKTGLNGNVTSTFPLNYVRITIKDKDDNLVGHSIKYNLNNHYYIDVAEMYEALHIDTLSKGTYTFNLRAGIARGGKDFETFEFTV